MEKHIVTELEKPIRLKDYGAGIFFTLPTKTSFRKAIDKKLIFVNEIQGTTATFIHKNDIVSYHPPDEITPKRVLDLILNVVYDDEYMSAIEKPPGIEVNGNKFVTIDNALPQNIVRSSLPDAVRPRPVHRLDYGTTGILLIGKTITAIMALNKMFENKEISKTYLAVVIGKLDPVGTIDILVDEKSAITHYKVLKTVPSKRFQCLNLVKINIETGRRHQIRKHFYSIGNPVLGDQEYGIEPYILIGKGIYLHASSLAFVHPFTSEKIYLLQNLPIKFEKIFGSDLKQIQE